MFHLVSNPGIWTHDLLIISLLPLQKDKKSLLLKNEPTQAFFSFIFGLFKQINQFLQKKTIWKNVHPVYIAGIRTHNLSKHEPSPINTRPGLPPQEELVISLQSIFGKVHHRAPSFYF